MATTIKLSDELVELAKRFGGLYSRSVPKQIEYWSRIGRIVEENPDLSFAMIKDILAAQDEVRNKETTTYRFGSKA